MPKLAHIYRYPVKGLQGATMQSTMLKPGMGVVDDRRFAFAVDPAVNGNEWNPPRSFLINAVNDNLLRYKHEWKDNRVTLIAPDGTSISFDAGNPQSIKDFNNALPAFMQDVTGGNVPLPRLVERRKDGNVHGNWDYTDTHLSIINLASVEAISKYSDTKLDPRRFRGNLLLDDLPAWEEFGFAGQRFSLGEAEIEITRPANRCPATMVNPQSGERDVKTPSFLADHFGHAFCGIYAHVVKAGRIIPGDALRTLGPSSATHVDAQPDNAPDYALWPKFAIVSKRDSVGETIFLTLVTATPWPLLNTPETGGKRLRIHLAPDNITSAHIERVENDTIILRVEPSQTEDPATGYLRNNVTQGSRLLFSGPFGVRN